MLASEQAKSNILEVALEAHHAGLCVAPPTEDGRKMPSVGTAWYNTRADEQQIRIWYEAGHHTGVGIIMGVRLEDTLDPVPTKPGDPVPEPVEDGIARDETLDFDNAEKLADYLDMAKAAGLGDLVARVRASYCEKTPKGGEHWIYYCTTRAKNTKLAQMPDENGRPKATIETRGWHGFVIVAPSYGRVHDSGLPYVRLAGGFDSIVTISAEERDLLHDLARSLDEMPRRTEAPRPVPTEQRDADNLRPGDDFAAQANWADILEPAGWARVCERWARTYWRRPGKKHGISANTAITAKGDLLYVFSTSTLFDSERGYGKFGAYAILNHAGDFSAAAKELAGKGYGAPPEQSGEIYSSHKQADDVAALRARVAELEAQLLARPVAEPARFALAGAGRDLNDAQLIEVAKLDGQGWGERFTKLWTGDMDGYGDDYSRAAGTLLDILAKWTGGDSNRMDRLFRASALMRPSFDETRGGSTLGENMTAFACAGFLPGQGTGYAPKYAAEALQSCSGCRLMAEVTELRKQVANFGAILKVPERRTLMAVFDEYSQTTARCQTDEKGMVRFDLDEMSKSSGVSKPTVTAHTRQAIAEGLPITLVTKVDYLGFDDKDGQHHRRDAIFGKIDATREAFEALVLTYEPNRPKRGRPVGRFCPKHPDADKIEKTSLTCAVCSDLLQESERIIKPERESTLASEPSKTFYYGADSVAAAPPSQPDAAYAVVEQSPFLAGFTGSTTLVKPTRIETNTPERESDDSPLVKPFTRSAGAPCNICESTGDTYPYGGAWYCAKDLPWRAWQAIKAASAQEVLS